MLHVLMGNDFLKFLENDKHESGEGVSLNSFWKQHMWETLRLCWGGNTGVFHLTFSIILTPTTHMCVCLFQDECTTSKCHLQRTLLIVPSSCLSLMENIPWLLVQSAPVSKQADERLLITPKWLSTSFPYQWRTGEILLLSKWASKQTTEQAFLWLLETGQDNGCTLMNHMNQQRSVFSLKTFLFTHEPFQSRQPTFQRITWCWIIAQLENFHIWWYLAHCPDMDDHLIHFLSWAPLVGAKHSQDHSHTQQSISWELVPSIPSVKVT